MQSRRSAARSRSCEKQPRFRFQIRKSPMHQLRANARAVVDVMADSASPMKERGRFLGIMRMRHTSKMIDARSIAGLRGMRQRRKLWLMRLFAAKSVGVTETSMRPRKLNWATVPVPSL
jgi:hypothetical protein